STPAGMVTTPARGQHHYLSKEVNHWLYLIRIIYSCKYASFRTLASTVPAPSVLSPHLSLALTAWTTRSRSSTLSGRPARNARTVSVPAGIAAQRATELGASS